MSYMDNYVLFEEIKLENKEVYRFILKEGK